MKRLRNLLQRFRTELLLYRRILADPRTPRTAKFLLGLAVAYTVTPLDLIPDFIPVLGHLDDVIIVPLLVWLAVRAIPQPLLDEHRKALGLGSKPAAP